MVNAKDKRGELEKSGVVYSMKYNDCDQVYVGETARNVKVRAKEHRALARNGNPELSAVAEHALKGHDVEWKPNVLCVADRMVEKRVEEAIRFHMQGEGAMNRDKGLELSKLWLRLFS